MIDNNWKVIPNSKALPVYTGKKCVDCGAPMKENRYGSEYCAVYCFATRDKARAEEHKESAAQLLLLRKDHEEKGFQYNTIGLPF